MILLQTLDRKSVLFQGADGLEGGFGRGQGGGVGNVVFQRGLASRVKYFAYKANSVLMGPYFFFR